MGMFSSLFGSSGSDKADKMRQAAIDAYGSIKTPELDQLKVQLDKYVSAGILSPEQAEVQLLGSNAFNDIATDPSLEGAQKQALAGLQDVANTGGMTAIDKARMQDITDEQNATAKGRNEAILSNAKERGVGGSGIETVNRLMNEQSAADRASRQGVDVASQAEARALQALQAAGQLGGQMQAQQFSQGAQKATAQNAIDAFNAQTRNANNASNTNTTNAAQGANLANAQTISNANTAVGNQEKTANAAANQQVFQDNLAKASGIAGTYNGWASDAQAQAAKEKAADMAITSQVAGAGASALGGAFAGPAGAAGGGGFTPRNPTEAGMNSGYSTGGYAEGGKVEEPENSGSLEDEYNKFVQNFCNGGSVKMADGGMVHIKPAKGKKNAGPSGVSAANTTPTPALPIVPAQDPSQWQLNDPKGAAIGSFSNYSDAADFAQKVKNKQPHVEDFRDGGKVPGDAPVAGDSPKNDIVPAQLSPDEIVIPRSKAANPAKAAEFAAEVAKNEDPTVTALRRLKKPNVIASVRG
jgi:hypothetical protein